MGGVNINLKEVYKRLDFESGELFIIAAWQQTRLALPPDEVLLREKWIEACLRINEKYGNRGIRVDAIFFIQQNPVAVFAKVNQSDKEVKDLAVRTLWNLARPRYLFLNDPTDTEVYDMGGALDLISPKPLGKGLSFLLGLNREVLQSGYNLLRGKGKSADVSLIQDLKELRRILTGNSKITKPQSKLTYPQAHTLIAQVIFIRYLEDRNILDETYFRERVVGTNKQWLKILETTPNKSILLNPDIADSFFPRILDDRDFTVALFKQLAADFNGDIFSDNREYTFVKSEHLDIIRRFLYADLDTQHKLFLWAYQFDVIPLELISSIYEEFYHGSNKAGKIEDKNGTHYTPSVLVEFMLSRVLTVQRLKTSPRVLDSACGSGIFLVESFRRIVRYKTLFEDFKPEFKSLSNIIKNQIRGIEINREAARVTAFSLYIALLDFLDPPHIRHYLDSENGKLPYLLYSKKPTKHHLNVILDSNAFWVENLFEQDKGLHDFQPDSVDVIVGNPPWGSAKKKEQDDKIAIEWCKQNGRPISDNEWSQMFIWRSLSLLRPNGVAALLVSSGTLMKSSPGAVNFKRKWASKSTMLEVFNFVLARHVFFDNAISPFLGVVFENRKPNVKHNIHYWTFRRTRLVESCQAVVLDRTDFKLISQFQSQSAFVWKTFQFGNQLDFTLIAGLNSFSSLANLEQPTGRRQGFIEGGGKSKKKSFQWIHDYKYLPTDVLKKCGRYNPIPFQKTLTNIPNLIKESGVEENYEGDRILFKRGISSKGKGAGNVLVRFEDKKFAFKDSINCFKLNDNADVSLYKLILGILWSSIAKYYYIKTVSQWGIWHDEVKPTEMMRLPIPEVEPDNKEQADKIISIVDNLRQNPFETVYWERQLDEAVFDFYYLTQAEKDLIRDRCNYEIDAYYKNHKSIAFYPVQGLVNNFTGNKPDFKNKSSDQMNGMEAYLDAFYEAIIPLLKAGSVLSHTVVRSKGLDHEDYTWSDNVAVIFYIENKNSGITNEDKHVEDWSEAVKLISKANKQIEISKSIYVDRFLRMVSEAGNKLFILKRNERRLWSRTAAREDAQALFTQSLSLPQLEPVINEI